MTGARGVNLGLPLLVFALVLLLLVQQFAVVPGHGRLAAGIQNGLHGPWFAIVTWIVYRALTLRAARPLALCILALAMPLLAIATEAMQLGTARDAEWIDIALDMLGCGAAFAWISAARANRSTRRASSAVAVVLLVGSLTPAVLAVAVQMHRNVIFPELVRVEAPLQGGLLDSDSFVRTLTSTAEWPGADGPILDVTLGDDAWPGVSLPEPVPDWRNYDVLAIHLRVPGREPLPLSVSIRLRNAPTDHVYRTFILPSGEHRLKVLLSDLFDRDVAKVTQVVIYSTRAYAGRRLLLRRVWLTSG